MKRVVITGTGIVSCIGNDNDTVARSLREGRSGIRAMPKFTELGLRSQVAGVPEIDLESRIDRKQLRFMGDAAAYAHIALTDAIAQAGLAPEQVSHPRTGLIMGSGGGSPANQIEAADTLRQRGIRRVGPYQVTRCMSSTVSACLSTNFGIRGVNYSITSACSTSAHCIGAASQQIAFGLQDVMFAGGGEELSWGMALLFDAMGAMSSAWNDTPERASRAYDVARDGFVLAGGGGAVVLESLEHAQARGATIHAEIVGFGTNSDGLHVTQPNAATMAQAMRLALADAGLAPEAIAYVSAHGTATDHGDIAESTATHAVFGARMPISALKSYTGHTLGACGALEAWVTLEMLREGWFHPTINLRSVDPRCGELDYVVGDGRRIDGEYAMSNNFAFGGINTSLVLRRWPH